MASYKEILVNTDSIRLLTFLKQYWNFGISVIYNEKKYHVDVNTPNDNLWRTEDRIYKYPIFTFVISQEIESIIRKLNQLTGDTNPEKETVGSLEIFDLRFDQCILQITCDETIFLEIERKILEEISKFWKIEIRQNIQDDGRIRRKRKNIINDDPGRLGKFIKTIDHPRRIQTGEGLSISDTPGPEELPYDRILVQLWRAGEKAEVICQKITEKYSRISKRRLYNRLSELRKLHPEWKIPYRRRNFKYK